MHCGRVGGVELDYTVGPSMVKQRIPRFREPVEMSVEEIETLLSDSGQVESLTGDILRRKVLDRVADADVAVDADGNVVDLTPVVVGESDDDEPAGDDGQDDVLSPEIEE